MTRQLQEMTEQELELYQSGFTAGRDQMLKQVLKLVDTKTYNCKDCAELGDFCPMDLQKNAWWSYIKFMLFNQISSDDAIRLIKGI